ncbi:MAG TPA: GT-D fold domain-containing glycosyltransferase [Bacillota bacterium]|nr:GT-D fold domain-containing glycosyltransferase [Bacillota bacterium]
MIAQQSLSSANEVLAKIKRALLTRKSFSLIRLGNGEALTLAHGVLVPMEQMPDWLTYAGVRLPDETARQELLNAIKTADIVGISTDRANWDCAPLLRKVFAHYNLRPRVLTDAAINWQLHRFDRLYHFLQGAPVALIGRVAPAAAPLLQKKGVNIVSVVTLEGLADIPRAESQILSGPPFRVALVAAGIPATILCPRLARKTNCIAIDYGHVINDLLKPGFNTLDLPGTVALWNQGIHF